MHFNGAIKFNNTSSSTLGLVVTEPPQIEHSKILTEQYTVPGKDGNLYGQDSYRSDAYITVKMELVKPGYESGYTNASFQNARRSIWTWLQGTGNLEIGDVTDSYYEVKMVEITTDERVLVNYGKIEVKFTVYPCEFLKTASKVNYTISAGTTDTFSLTTDKSEPLYLLTNSGNSAGTVTINGTAISIEQNQSVNVDTRRRIAYYNSTDKSSVVGGDYAGMALKKGSNTITTGATVTCKIVSSRDGYII